MIHENIDNTTLAIITAVVAAIYRPVGVVRRIYKNKRRSRPPKPFSVRDRRGCWLDNQ